MRRIRSHLTYANVMVTVLAFIVLGGTALAVAKLDKNSVGSKQLKSGAVHTADIADAAVTAAKLAPDALGTTTVRSVDATVPLTCTESNFGPNSYILFCNGQASTTVSCNPGEHATGGGFKPAAPSTATPTPGTPTSSSSVLSSKPEPATGTPTGWTVDAQGSGANSGTSAGLAHPADPQFTAYVVCST